MEVEVGSGGSPPMTTEHEDINDRIRAYVDERSRDVDDELASLRAELDAARAREQQLEASLHSLCCAVCREPGAKGWCQSCFDRACKEVDQARGAWAREAKLREALSHLVRMVEGERDFCLGNWLPEEYEAVGAARAALAEGEDTRG